VADALLRHAEQRIAERFATAWLAVVEGNGRARRFYERCGWHDAGCFDYQAEIEGGRLPVRSRRYEKRLQKERS
jgi:ribosomal protein S18 acetylase RimI-like enzyme